MNKINLISNIKISGGTTPTTYIELQNSNYSIEGGLHISLSDDVSIVRNCFNLDWSDEQIHNYLGPKSEETTGIDLLPIIMEVDEETSNAASAFFSIVSPGGGVPMRIKLSDSFRTDIDNIKQDIRTQVRDIVQQWETPIDIKNTAIKFFDFLVDLIKSDYWEVRSLDSSVKYIESIDYFENIKDDKTLIDLLFTLLKYEVTQRFGWSDDTILEHVRGAIPINPLNYIGLKEMMDLYNIYNELRDYPDEFNSLAMLYLRLTRLFRIGYIFILQDSDSQKFYVLIFTSLVD